MDVNKSPSVTGYISRYISCVSRLIMYAHSSVDRGIRVVIGQIRT